MQDTASNIPIYSVSQISAEVRRAIEGQFEWVRIRGEVSRPTRARSGHFYLTLKDEKAVIDAVAWKGVAAKIPFDVSEGMELIATGKLTTFAGHSKYQLIIETLELAGEGALLKMLEMRRKALHAEGLFDSSVKKPLPLLPRRIGVVSSPNGAVIRDIWHRISDRFPLGVTLWPVRVQGQGAAGEVARAIAGFDAMPADVRPDLLIVARGGGSLEDLWTFNEEEVIRAAAACQIPLISAIGHETDTTLLDYVADLRAPTPTAAAEFAVPIRTDLLAEVAQLGERAKRSLFSNLQQSQQGLDDVSRALGSPDALVSRAARDLAAVVQSLTQAQRPYFERLALTLDHAWSRLPKPRQKLLELWQSLKSLDARARMAGALRRAIAQGEQQIEGLGARLEAQHRAREALKAQGWAHVLDDKGQSLVSAGQVLDGEGYTLRFHDGDAAVVGGASGGAVPADAPNKPKRLSKPAKTNPHQDTLF